MLLEVTIFFCLGKNNLGKEIARNIYLLAKWNGKIKETSRYDGTPLIDLPLKVIDNQYCHIWDDQLILPMFTDKSIML